MMLNINSKEEKICQNFYEKVILLRIDKMMKKRTGSWNFKNMEKKFDNHIRKSIPLYDRTHDIILRYSHFFVHNKSNIYDLGCSTGKLIQKLSNYLN